MILMPDLFSFAYVPNWYSQLDMLAEMALPEPWRFKNPIYLTKNPDTLRFLCPDPYGYALYDETFTLSQAGEHEVEREIGNTDSEPVYSLQGTISSGALVLTTNGEALRVIGPLAAEEVLVIDTGMVTAKVTDSAGNTLRNGLPCLEELNFPILRRGVNEVEIAVEGSAIFTELHIQAKSRWR